MAQTNHLTLTDIQDWIAKTGHSENANYNATAFHDEQELLKRSGFTYSASGAWVPGTNNGKYWDSPISYKYGNAKHTGGVIPIIEAMDIDWRPYAVRISTNPNDNEATSYSYIATTMDLMLTLTQKFAAIDSSISDNQTNNTADLTNLTNRIDAITYAYSLSTNGAVVTLSGSNPGTSVTFAGDNTWTSVTGPSDASENGTITISHIGSAVTAAAGGTGKYVSSVKFDAHGHATEISYATLPTLLTSETAANTYKVSLSNGGAASSITMTGDGWVIPTSNVLAPANETITFTHKTISNAAGTVTAPPTANNFITGIVTDGKGHITSYYYDDIKISSYSIIRSAAQNDTTPNSTGDYLSLIYTPEGGNATVATTVSLADYRNEAIPTPVLSYIIDGGFRLQLGTGNNSNTLPISLTNTFAYPGNHTYNHSRYGLELKVGDTTVADISYLYAKNSDAVTLHYPVSRTVDGDTHPVVNSDTKLYLPGVIPSTTLSPSYKDETDHWIYVSNGADGQSFPYILYTDSTYVLHTPNLNAVVSISYDSDGFKVKTNKGTASAAVPFDVSYISGTSGTGKGLTFTIGSTAADVVSFKLAKNESANTFGLRINGEVAGSDIEFPTLSLANNQRTNGQYMSDTSVNGHTITNSYISLLSASTATANTKGNGKYVSDTKINSTGNIELTYTNLLDSSTSAGTNLYVSKLEINSSGNIKATYTSLPTIPTLSLGTNNYSTGKYVAGTGVSGHTITHSYISLLSTATSDANGKYVSDAVINSSGSIELTYTNLLDSSTSAGTNLYVSKLEINSSGNIKATYTSLPTLSVASNQRTNGQYMADTSVSGHTITNSYISLLNGNNDAANTKYVSKLEINSSGNIKASYTTLLSASSGSTNHAGYIANIVNDSGTLKATYGSFAPSIANVINSDDGTPMVKITVAGCDSETDTIQFSSYTAGVYSKQGIPQYQGVTPSSEWDDIFNQHVDGNDSLLVSALNDTRINKGVAYIGAWTQTNHHNLYIDPVTKTMQGNVWVDFVKTAPFILNTDTKVKYLFAPSIVTSNIYGVATQAINLTSDPGISYVNGNSGGIKIKVGDKASTVLPVAFSYVTGNNNGLRLSIGSQNFTTPFAFSYVSGNNNGLRLSVGGQNFTVPVTLGNGTTNNIVKLTVGSVEKTVTVNNVANATNAALADKVMVAQIEAGKNYNLVGPTSDEIGRSGASLRGHTTYLLFDCSSDVNRLKPIFRIGCDTTCGKLDTSEAITCASGGVTITAGGLTVSAGGATISAGGLTVTGNSTFNNNLTVKGNTNLGDANSDTTTIKGNLIVGGTTYGPKVSSGNNDWAFWNTSGSTKGYDDIIEHGHAVVSPDPVPRASLGGGFAISGERITYIETRSTVPDIPNANTMYVLI